MIYYDLSITEQHLRIADMHSFGVTQIQIDGDELVKYAESIIPLARIESDDFRGTLIAAIYSKIISGFHATVILCNAPYTVEAEIIARSTLEALFYMGACAKSGEAYNRYIRKDLDELRRLKADTEREPTAFISYFREEIAKIWRMAEEIFCQESKSTLTAKEAAKYAGLEVFYQYMYRIHSRATHTTAGYLLSNYISLDGDKVSGIHPGKTPVRLEDVLFSSVFVLLQACQFYQECFDIPTDDFFNGLYRKYAEYKPPEAGNT